MPTAPRRPGVAAPPPPVVEIVNLGDDALYSGGGGFPEGNYALYFDLRNYQAVKQNGAAAGPPRLGVMISAYDLSEANPSAAQPREQFYSFGSTADKSFQPTPDGKALMRVPGGPATTLQDSTNWAVLRQSMIDCDPMIQQVFQGDFSVLDGMWAHMSHIPEPEGRKSYKAKTADDFQQSDRPRTIVIVSEVMEGGKPWEGGGGVPDTAVSAAPAAPVAAAPPARPAPAGRPAAPAPRPAVAAPAARPPAARPALAPRPAPAPPPPAAAAVSDEDVMNAASGAASTVLGKFPGGLAKTLFRVNTFTEAQAAYGDATAQAVIEMYFANDDATNVLLGSLGYSIQGATIKPAA